MLNETVNIDNLKAKLENTPKINQEVFINTKEICQLADAGKFEIPPFKVIFDNAWDAEQKVAFLNSMLYSKMPPSTLAFNVDGSMPDLHTFLPNNQYHMSAFDKIEIIDGIQRINLLYDAWINNYTVKNIVLDLEEGKFRTTQATRLKPSLLPLGILLNRDENIFSEYLRKISDQKEAYFTLYSIRAKLLSNYNFSILTTQNQSLEEQRNWWHLLNQND